MSQSRLLIYMCLSFAMGIAGENWIAVNLKIIGLVVLFLFMIGVFLTREIKIRLIILFWVIFYLGIVYSNYLADGSLIGSVFLAPIVVRLGDLRELIENLCARLISEPYASLLNGILLGTKSGFGPDLYQAFKITGLMHIVAISGYNVTIIVNSFFVLAKPLALRLRMGLTLGLIILFIILTGGSASVIRAGIMGGLVVAARLFGRKALALNSLILAGFLMVAERPYILVHDIGFQLSVAATLGLVLFSPILKRVGERGVVKLLPETFREALFSTLAAQVMTAPIIFYYFKNLSLVSPIANLLILPIIPLAMSIGFMVILAGLLYFPIGYVLGFGAWLILYVIVWVVEKLALIPYASMNTPAWMMSLIIPYYIWLAYLIWSQPKQGVLSNEKT
ncbi:MAG: ComEC/Rec2 family competence protein [bacterium]|nr:ComEC/Rec2 family competence protein [bacterium]